MNFSITYRKVIIGFLFACTIGFLQSCVKDQDLTEVTTIELPDAKELVKTNIFGLVVDENDQPMVNSSVLLKTEMGFETTTTDENGNFLYQDVRVLREGAFLKVQQAGKFEGFRKMNVTPNSYNYTKIKLLEKTIVGTVSSNSGGMVSHSSSAQLELPSNAVRYENGGEYTGTVSVAMNWIDPTAEDLPERMVGDLSGIDIGGKEVYLGTYGMLNVELLAENGEELQLKDGKPATLSFPVPAEIRGQAPEVIPLWSYNENQGIWLEEGSATLEGGFYVGDVAHFSSWNCDYKGERITITGKVVTRNNADEDMAVSFFQVYVTVEDILNRGGYLDDSGEFEFFNFPRNKAFTLTIKNYCGEVVYEEEYGPYANDFDLGTLVVQANSIDFVTVNGSGKGCDGSISEDSYVDFALNNLHYYYPLEEDGMFEFVVSVCENPTSSIYLLDVTNQKESAIQTLDLSNETVNVGTLIACEELSSFIDVQVDGADYQVFFPVYANVGEEAGILYLSANSSFADTTGTEAFYYYINMSINDVTGVGIYAGDGNGNNNDDGIFASWGSENQQKGFNLVSDVSTFEITEYGANSGDIIRGIFTGEAITTDETGVSTQVPVSATFKLRLQ